MRRIQWLQDWMPTDDLLRARYLKLIAHFRYKPITLERRQEDLLLNGCLGGSDHNDTGIFEVTPIEVPWTVDDSGAATSRRKKRDGSNSRICSPTSGNNLLYVVEDANGDTFQILHVSTDHNYCRSGE